ncbi:hypothetical protein VTI74DRAFT_3206 [Chaetomium olivicolor]
MCLFFTQTAKAGRHCTENESARCFATGAAKVRMGRSHAGSRTAKANGLEKGLPGSTNWKSPGSEALLDKWEQERPGRSWGKCGSGSMSVNQSPIGQGALRAGKELERWWCSRCRKPWVRLGRTGAGTCSEQRGWDMEIRSDPQRFTPFLFWFGDVSSAECCLGLHRTRKTLGRGGEARQRSESKHKTLGTCPIGSTKWY